MQGTNRLSLSSKVFVKVICLSKRGFEIHLGNAVPSWVNLDQTEGALTDSATGGQ